MADEIPPTGTYRLDRSSSASCQFFIDTGRYLTDTGEDPADLPEGWVEEPTDEEIAALIEPKEEEVPVIIAVHNGVVIDGRPMFAPSNYLVPISKLQQVQRYLSKHEVLG